LVVPKGYKVDEVKVNFRNLTVDDATGQDALPVGDMMRRFSLFSHNDGESIRVIHFERDLAHDVAYWSNLRQQQKPENGAEFIGQVQNDPVVVNLTPGRATYKFRGPFPGGEWGGQLELQQIADVFPAAANFEVDVGISLLISRDDQVEELVRIAAKRINSANYVDIMASVAPWIRMGEDGQGGQVTLVAGIRSIEHNGVALSADAIDDLIRTYNEMLGFGYDDDITELTEFGYNLIDMRDVRIYFNNSVDVFICGVQSVAQVQSSNTDYDTKYREQGDVFEVDPTKSRPL
jgi:hypothetical protein